MFSGRPVSGLNIFTQIVRSG